MRFFFFAIHSMLTHDLKTIWTDTDSWNRFKDNFSLNWGPLNAWVHVDLRLSKANVSTNQHWVWLVRRRNLSQHAPKHCVDINLDKWGKWRQFTQIRHVSIDMSRFFSRPCSYFKKIQAPLLILCCDSETHRSNNASDDIHEIKIAANNHQPYGSFKVRARNCTVLNMLIKISVTLFRCIVKRFLSLLC